MANTRKAKANVPPPPSEGAGGVAQVDDQSQSEGGAETEAKIETETEVAAVEVAVDYGPYPATLDITNNTPSKLCFPAISNDVFMPYQTHRVVVQDKAQIDGFVSDAKHLADLNGWTDPFTVVRAEVTEP